ncbi:MAG: division plane positioning ATPase MipZ [Chthoniobacteraceae bacterium]
MIVLCGGEKGGTGKSTLATNLAVWLAHQGKDVLLVDTDRQLTASRWIDRRHALGTEFPMVHGAEKHGNVFHALRDFATRYDEIIVDAGGRDSEELRTAMVAAQIVYLPLRTSQPDLETAVHMHELVSLARGLNPTLRARWLLTMAPAGDHGDTAEAARTLRELPAIPLADIIIRDRKIYRDAMASGHGVTELLNDKAQAEIDALGHEIYR